MIVIDGRQSELALKDFENLEQILENVLENDALQDRIVTDVLLNGQPFSEIYPHQAEDIESQEIEKVEILSVPVVEMAVDITQELYKVVTLMGKGGREVAELFRQADDAEALETYQDLLDVVRSFLGMISTLREEFGLRSNPEFVDASKDLSALFTEMTEVLANEDWVLLADLLEYEFLPAVSKWEAVIGTIRFDIEVGAGATA
ncbi:hypothetical protein [Paucidesulfovibrio longus]|jgi:hypothetical protein|uniref:hypothetical protein n=1 Tax=Paucidesulfovibrio longus TaxID=889 RepID=UPI0003B5F052|nr:hypothetical protein [Paucidesulfovibrio longus]